MSDKAKYFPLFLDISTKKIAIFGGGTIAVRRALTLSRFDVRPEIIAPELSLEMQKLVEEEKVTHVKAVYMEGQLLGKDIVLACTNQPEVNHCIFEDCKKRNILVNNCSNKEECDFYFPAIVQKEDVVIGINGGGKNHSRVKQIRELIEDDI